MLRHNHIVNHAPEPHVDESGALHVPAQIIPPPSSVSDQARAVLTMPRLPAPSSDQPRDREAWLALAAQADQAVEPRIQWMLQGTEGCVTEQIDVAGVSAYVVTPPNIPAERQDWARITVHGGGYVMMGGRYAAAEAAQAAIATQCVVIGVDYRKPPDFPYPTPVDDVVTIYEHVLGTYRPEKIAISGNSAGATLAAAAVLKARDAGLPLPGAVTLSTPLVDLTMSGDTWTTNLHLDHLLGVDPHAVADVYAGDADRTDPYVSPLFGDFGRGFPPTILTSGTRDRLLSDTVLLHRKLRQASIEADLHVWDAGPHGNFMIGPERDDQDAEELAFVVKHLSRG